MKTLLFSDVHLTHNFEPEKFEMLRRIIKDVDRVIINGDFWDRYRSTFDKFINSKWQELFSILKAKKTIYIFGNHDLPKYCDERVNEFSDLQSTFFEFDWQNKIIHIEHGNRIIPGFIEKHPFFERSKYIFAFMAFAHNLKETVLNKLFGPKKIYAGMHKKFKKQILKIKKANEIWLCGHTHVQDLDVENGYANSGLISFGYFQYLIMDDKEITKHAYFSNEHE